MKLLITLGLVLGLVGIAEAQQPKFRTQSEADAWRIKQVMDSGEPMDPPRLADFTDVDQWLLAAKEWQDDAIIWRRAAIEWSKEAVAFQQKVSAAKCKPVPYPVLVGGGSSYSAPAPAAPVVDIWAPIQEMQQHQYRIKENQALGKAIGQGIASQPRPMFSDFNKR